MVTSGEAELSESFSRKAHIFIAFSVRLGFVIPSAVRCIDHIFLTDTFVVLFPAHFHILHKKAPGYVDRDFLPQTEHFINETKNRIGNKTKVNSFDWSSEN